MQLNSFLNLCFYLFHGLAGRYATRKVWNIGCIVPFSFFDHYRITHGKVSRFFSPACFKVLFSPADTALFIRIVVAPSSLDLSDDTFNRCPLKQLFPLGCIITAACTELIQET